MHDDAQMLAHVVDIQQTPRTSAGQVALVVTALGDLRANGARSIAGGQPSSRTCRALSYMHPSIVLPAKGPVSTGVITH